MARFAIRAYIGPNGSGKSYGVMEDVVVPAWRKGQTVWSNTRLRPEALGFDAGLYRPITSLRVLLEASHGVVYFGEISSVLPAREFADVAADVIRRIKQLRKRDVVLVWDSPSWDDADIALRRVTKAVTLCRSYVPDPYVRIPGTANIFNPFGIKAKRDGKALKVEGWPSMCLLFRWTYAAEQFPDEFQEIKIKGIKSKERKSRWRPFSKIGQGYDTLEEVALFDHLDRDRRCLTCGGVKRAKPCTCKVDGVPNGSSMGVLS